jgi:hypothetical protein
MADNQENQESAKAGKDFWDKVDIVLRPLNGLLTALAVALLGYYTSSVLRQRDTAETNSRVYAELTTGREQAESALRKDMSLSIMQTFLRPETAGLDAKMLNLEMLAYNFHDSLNLKPLFAYMERQIASSNEPGKASIVSRLDQTANEITTRQLVLLEQVGQKFSRSIDFEKFHPEKDGPLELEPQKLTLRGVEREFALSVVSVDPQRKLMQMELNVRLAGDASSGQRVRFHVGYYDFPMIDNTRLSNDQRAAVVLNQFEPGVAADVSLVLFPGSYSSLKEHVSIDEVVEKLRGLKD